MTFVIIATFIHKIKPVVEGIDNMYCVKQKGPKAFFYYNGDNTDVLRMVKKEIMSKLGNVYVYEAYPLYKGIIDLTPYLPLEIKESKPYYKRPQDLKDSELEAFKLKHNI